MARDDDKKCECGDEVTLGPELGNGLRIGVRHTEDHQVAVALVRTIGPEDEIPDDAIALDRIEGDRYRARELTSEERRGPSRANSRAYRNNYDTIFGKKQTVGQA